MTDRFMVCDDCLKQFYGGSEKSCSHGWDLMVQSDDVVGLVLRPSVDEIDTAPQVERVDLAMLRDLTYARVDLVEERIIGPTGGSRIVEARLVVVTLARVTGHRVLSSGRLPPRRSA